jgi:hypothetical protein
LGSPLLLAWLQLFHEEVRGPVISESFQRELSRGVADDSLSWLVNLGWAHAFPHLAWATVPTAVLAQAASHGLRSLRRRSPRNFTAWKEILEDLPDLYRADWAEAVTILFEGRERVLPQRLLAAAGRESLQLRVHMRPEPFRLSEPVRELASEPQERLIRYLQRRDAYHRKTRKGSMCLAVRACARAGHTVTLEAQPLAYDDVLATHYALDVDWLGRASLRQYLLGRTGHSLGALEDSPVPNILGVDVLIFTPSGSLILQRRSRRVAVRPGEMCASSSGGASPDDVATRSGKLRVIREGAEELALDPDKIVPDSVQFLGLARDFASHGVVESYFCADTLENDAEILAKARSAEDREEHAKVFFFHFGDELVRGSLSDHDVRREGFVRKMDEFIRRRGKHFSTPLFTALALWQKKRLRS